MTLPIKNLNCWLETWLVIWLVFSETLEREQLPLHVLVSLLHPHLPLCGAPASVDCLARGPAAVWHGIAGPGVTYAVSLLLPFVRHTLLFPGFIHSAMVRRQIEVSPLTGVTLM